MPSSVAAFFFFGVGSLPAGKLGDQWGRRSMMIIFFIGIGVAAIGVSLAQSTIQLAVALALLGAFASIYHPVGIPLLVQGSTRPGWTSGINGLCGNMGVALAAVITGILVKFFGWRTAFVVPGLVSIACGALFANAGTNWTSPNAMIGDRKAASPHPTRTGKALPGANRIRMAGRKTSRTIRPRANARMDFRFLMDPGFLSPPAGFSARQANAGGLAVSS